MNEGARAWTGENRDWLDTGVGMQWSIAGAEATREQLRDAGFTVVETWGVPETLGQDPSDGDTTEDDSGGEAESGSDDDPWVFFSARLDG